jgi:hypothetical protein
VSAERELARIDVDESLDAIEAFDVALARDDRDDRPGDTAQAVLLAATAVVFAIRELGLRLEAMGE